MNKEESLDLLQKAYHLQATGGNPPWDPQFAGAVKTAIDTLVIEVSKQKIKEILKENKNAESVDTSNTAAD